MSSQAFRLTIYAHRDGSDRLKCGEDCSQMTKSWTGRPTWCRAFGKQLPVTSGGEPYRLPMCLENEEKAP